MLIESCPFVQSGVAKISGVGRDQITFYPEIRNLYSKEDFDNFVALGCANCSLQTIHRPDGFIFRDAKTSTRTR